MSDTPEEFSDEFGNVVSLVIRRQGLQQRRWSGACQHRKLFVDTSLAKLECKDCGKEINAVEWVANTTQFYASLRHERHRYEQAKVHYEIKSRCKCEHCGKMTKIRPATGAEVRNFQKAKP